MQVISMRPAVGRTHTETISLYHLYLFATCFIGGAVGGAVSTLMSVYLPVVVKELSGSKDAAQLNTISGYINALFICGWAIGGFTWGLISDRLGRKKALIAAMVCYGMATVLTGFTGSWWSLMACRFCSGFGVGGVLVLGITLLSEVWPQRSKAVFIGFLSIAFPVGIFSAGLINYFVTSWRQGFMVGLIPLSLALIGMWLLQESPKWKAHIANETQKQETSLFAATHRSQLVVGSIIYGAMLIGLWAIFSWLPTWVQTMAASADAQQERGLSMMCLGMGGLSGGFFSGWIINRLGTRRALIICFSVCTVLSALLFTTNKTITPLLYVQIGVLAFFFGASQGVLSSYIPHLFDTGIRASATGFCFNIGRLFTTFAVVFVSVLVASLGGLANALLLFSLAFVVGLLIVLFVLPKSYKQSFAKN